MGRTEFHTQDAVDAVTGEAHANVTGETSDTRRGAHVAELPITSAKLITPADDTDVDFAHRYLYIGGTAGNVSVKFTSGGSAYVIPVAANAFLPMRVYSVQSTSTTATPIWLFG